LAELGMTRVLDSFTPSKPFRILQLTDGRAAGYRPRAARLRRLGSLDHLDQIIRAQPAGESGLDLGAGHVEVMLGGDERLIEWQPDGRARDPAAGDALEARFAE